MSTQVDIVFMDGTTEKILTSDIIVTEATLIVRIARESKRIFPLVNIKWFDRTRV